MSRDLSLRLDLLDRQIVDVDELPLGRVDDLVLESAGGPPRVAALLVGAQAIGERIGGWRGALLARVAARMRAPHDEPGPARIPIEQLHELDLDLRLRAPLAQLRHVAGLEHWLAEHVIGPLPGSGHDAGE